MKKSSDSTVELFEEAVSSCDFFRLGHKNHSLVEFHETILSIIVKPVDEVSRIFSKG